jgi:hypothetical protein
MNAHPPFGSPSFKLVAKGLVELHRLMKDGKDDSPEAEAVRDALDAPMKALNRTEKERAQWLSEDLYSVSEPSAATAQKEMNPQAQQQLIEADEARQRRDWDRALTLLRQWADYLTPDVVSFVRGRIWLEAGHPETAVLFLEHAVRLQPDNDSYSKTFLHALGMVNPQAAQERAANPSQPG